jgi:hypothetical protein
MATAIEMVARRRAAAAGMRALKSRKAYGGDNFGGFMLVDAEHNYVITGSRYDLSPEDVIEICRPKKARKAKRGHANG